jgi:hypothetical protein
LDEAPFLFCRRPAPQQKAAAQHIAQTITGERSRPTQQQPAAKTGLPTQDDAKRMWEMYDKFEERVQQHADAAGKQK